MDSQNKSKKQSNFHGVTIIEETELSIFDAHKYFSETEMNSPKQEKSPRQHRQEQKLHGGDHLISGARSMDIISASVEYGYGSRDFRTRSFRGTPTASSEASWNSRTGLLRNPPASSAGVASTANSPSDDHCSSRKSSASAAAAAAKRWKFLGRKCCCTGGKSVQVVNTTVITSESEQKGPAGIFVNGGDEKTPRQMIQNGISRRRSSSSFTRDIIEIHQNKARVSSSGRPFLDGGGVVGFTFPILKNSSGDQANKSIVNSPSTAKNPVGGGCFNQGSTVARDDDVGSDASSDLFEIESFSTTQTTSYHMYRRRDSADEEPTSNASRIIASSNRIVQYGGRNLDERRSPPSVAATECYPPSEVSVDWSVTTAEGFDRARIADVSASALGKRVEEEGGGDGGKSKGSNNGLMAMGCRQEKAVSVGPPAVKCLAAEGPPMFPLRGVNRPPRANKPPLARPHSARLSLAFAA
ncbi:hypothetical protein ACP275_11G020600 [Erythranthe tilingii]